MFSIGLMCNLGSVCKNKLDDLEKEFLSSSYPFISPIPPKESIEETEKETDNLKHNKTPIEETSDIESPPPISEKQTLFRLPIQYLEEDVLHPISTTVTEDLELHSQRLSAEIDKSAATAATPPPSPEKSMYDILFQPTHSFAKNMKKEWSKQFTSHTGFLSDTQKVIRNMRDFPTHPTYVFPEHTMLEIWSALKEDDSFLEKYGYMERSMLTYLNTSSSFLQSLSIINSISPLTSILIPIILMVVPFVILKIRGIEVNFSVYFQILKDIAKNHFIGKAIHSIENFSASNFGYLFVMVGLYFLQIYQNITHFIHFYQNIQKINRHLTELKSYVDYSIQNMKWFIEKNRQISTYHPFHIDIQSNIHILEKIREDLKDVYEFRWSFHKLSQIGYMLKCYYMLYIKEEYGNALQYSLYFEGFLDNMKGICHHLEKGNVQEGSFYKVENENDDVVEEDEIEENAVEEEEEEEDIEEPLTETDKPSLQQKKKTQKKQKKQTTIIRQQYYPPYLLVGDQYIKNDCDLEKNIIITGVNASGKTTTIKTTAINILFTQQFGIGFYESCRLLPYTHIHSYLNIPDTSGRDSLFQAESRRCKKILDSISDSNRRVSSSKSKPMASAASASANRHFCIFDELYSGTNPEEATKTAYSFLLYISQFPNVDVLLTSHYTSICKRIQSTDRIENYEMVVEKIPQGGFHYTYQLRKGICLIQGAIEILKSMDYPEEMIQSIENYNDVENERLFV